MQQPPDSPHTKLHVISKSATTGLNVVTPADAWPVPGGTGMVELANAEGIAIRIPLAAFPFLQPGDNISVALVLTRVSLEEPETTALTLPERKLILPGKGH